MLRRIIMNNSILFNILLVILSSQYVNANAIGTRNTYIVKTIKGERIGEKIYLFFKGNYYYGLNIYINARTNDYLAISRNISKERFELQLNPKIAPKKKLT